MVAWVLLTVGKMRQMSASGQCRSWPTPLPHRRPRQVASVTVLVRPESVYVNAGLSCGSPFAHRHEALPHRRWNTVRVPF